MCTRPFAGDGKEALYILNTCLQERQIYEKSTGEKLLAAERSDDECLHLKCYAVRFRLEGNEAVKQKNFGLASVNYRKVSDECSFSSVFAQALLQFDYTFPDKPEEEEWMKREKLAAHLNMAYCKIHQKVVEEFSVLNFGNMLQDWDEALSQCRLSLEIDPRNCKALYRRYVKDVAILFFVLL